MALTPLAFGLHVLTGMRLSPRAGYPVIGDLGHDTAYVMVSPHSADGAPVVDGVRVLGAGHLLLVPDTVRTASPHGTFCAHWISAPRADRYERLVDGQTLAAHLHQLHSTHRKAPAS
ncbi:hypothetical protein SSPIM334S_06918 [Streptomyces spiroverticillatus]|uniref:hypothetical protein n=1 Tax=Streptomyces finlayi TaxID=67296 RepID=UPI00167737FE|nr:hypothetical protein [Streptomyces finlayi]